MGIGFEYKGFVGTLRYSQEDDSFHGKILDIIPTHHYFYDGKNRELAEKDFRVSVDEYLASSAVMEECEGDLPLFTNVKQPIRLKPWYPWKNASSAPLQRLRRVFFTA